jgi:hypothetical protein
MAAAVSNTYCDQAISYINSHPNPANPSLLIYLDGLNTFWAHLELTDADRTLLDIVDTGDTTSVDLALSRHGITLHGRAIALLKAKGPSQTILMRYETLHPSPIVVDDIWRSFVQAATEGDATKADHIWSVIKKLPKSILAEIWIHVAMGNAQIKEEKWELLDPDLSERYVGVQSSDEKEPHHEVDTGSNYSGIIKTCKIALKRYSNP